MTYNQYNLIRHITEEEEKEKLFGKLVYVSFIVLQNSKQNKKNWSVFTS